MVVRVVVVVTITASDKVCETVVVGTLLVLCVVKRVRQADWEYVATLASTSRGTIAAKKAATKGCAFMIEFQRRGAYIALKRDGQQVL